MTVNTWVTAYNTALDSVTYTTLNAQARHLGRLMKDLILAAGYTVYQSGDAVTAGTEGDGVDRWDADTDLTWAAAGTAHSWFAFKRGNAQLPNSKFTYIVLDLSTGASNQHLITVAVGSSAPSGGTNTAAPTMTTANRQIFTSKQWLRATLANSKVHTGYSDKGDWFLLVSPDGTGRVITAFGSFISGPSTYESGVNYPCLDFYCYADSAAGGLVNANLSSSSTTMVMFHTDGTAQSTGNFGLLTPVWVSTDAMAQFTNAGSSITGRYPMVPAIIGQGTTTIAFKGTLVDVWLAPTGSGINYGTEEPSTGTSEFAIMGSLWLPNGGVAPQL